MKAPFIVIATLLLAAAPGAHAQPGRVTPEAVVREYVAAQEARDIGRLMAVVADTLEVHPPPVEDLPSTPGVFGRKEVREMYESTFAMPGADRVELAELIAAGSWVATRERYGSLTDSAVYESILVHLVRDGRIRATWMFSGEMRPDDPHAAGAPAVVREHVAAQSARDLERLMAVFGDSLEVHSGAGDEMPRVVLDRPSLRTLYGDVFSERPPEHRIEITGILASGEWVATRERFTGIDEPGEGLAIYRVHGGRIVGMWIFDPEQVQ